MKEKALRSAGSVHSLIEEVAYKAPNKIALIYKDESLTYGQLNVLSNQVAHSLIELGVKKGEPVGILISRSFFMIVGLIAVLKAGAAYVPIDPDYPTDRIDFMLKDSGSNLLISESTSIANIKFQGQIIWLDQLTAIQLQPSSNPTILLEGKDLAYIIYTSGSTGKPKGVKVSHSNLFHAYCNWQQTYQLQERHCHLQMANFSFDVFTGDLVRALCSGGRLVLCPKDILLQPAELYSLMQKEKINCAEFVPTVIRRLIKFLEHENLRLDFMKLLVVGSDNWSIGEYCKLQKLCHSQTRVISSYGLTEATIDSTFFEEPLAEENFKSEHSVPIGKPFPNTEIYVLDKHHNNVIGGGVGELYIGGKGLSLGYLNRPELNTAKFVTLPLFNDNEKLYKTGDLGRLLPDGNIEFLGRIDNQVKLRGMRIELSDIENTLTCYPSVRESLVILAKDEADHEQLIAYLVLETGHSPDVATLRQYLKSKLPNFMIPTGFVYLESLPLTPNGKLDRSTLAFAYTNGQNDLVLPRTEVEKQLANLWNKILRIKDVSVFHHFDDMGGDSLSLANLMVEVEKHFGVKIPKCQFTKHVTLNKLALMIEELLVALNE